MFKVKMIVSGRVQGVGFRYFVIISARELGILGRVWNNSLPLFVGKNQVKDVFHPLLKSLMSNQALQISLISQTSISNIRN